MNQESRKRTIQHILRWMTAEEKQKALSIIDAFSDEALASSLRGKRRFYSVLRPVALPITERYHKCEHCGKYYQGDGVDAVDSDGYSIIICHECRDESFFQCSHCSEIKPNSEDDGDSLCFSCAANTIECHDCGNRVDNDDAIYSEIDGERYCEHCYDQNFVTCNSCGDEVRRDDSYFSGGDYYCDDCYNNRPESIIHDYDWSPDFPRYGTERRFGVEIEVEGDRDLAVNMRDAFDDDIYMKNDASLDDGFEIVTMPFLFEDILRIASSVGNKAQSLGLRGDNDTCGIHVHVSRAGINNIDETIAKLLLLFSVHSDKVERFARRDCKQWAAISKKPKIEFEEDSKDGFRREKNARYRAINLLPYKTIEFRIFKGTTNGNTIKAILQFVNAVIDYCEVASITDVECSDWKDIFKSKVNDPNYKEMFEFMSNPRRGLWKQE